MNIQNFLKGYKTYIVAAFSAVYGIVDKHGSFNQLLPYVLTGLGLATLRAAIAKAEQAVNALEAKLPATVQTVVVPVTNAVEQELNAAVDAATGVADAGSKPTTVVVAPVVQPDTPTTSK